MAAPDAPASTTAPSAGPKVRHFILWGLAALALNAGIVAVLHYSLANPSAANTAADTPPVREAPMEIVDLPPPAPATPPPAQTTVPPANVDVIQPSKVGTITVNGKTHTYALSAASAQYRTYSPPPPVAPTRATTHRPAVVVQPAPAADSPPAASSHTGAARAHAYQHFRYSYKIGSTDYEITSLNITTTGTTEVSGWSNRYRTTGTAGLGYYANSGFKRTTRKFEVITEVQNGTVTAIEIDVKY